MFNDRDETLNYELDDLESTDSNINFTFYRRIRVREVKDALRKMTSGKTVGPDGIPIEVWKCMGEKSVLWLTKLFNEILRSKKMPEDWRKSTLVPIYKNKGDIQSCENYRGINS